MYSKINSQRNKNGTIREYLQIVESNWDSDKGYSIQKLLLNVARVDNMDEKTRKMLTGIADGILKTLGMRIVDGEVIPDMKKTGEKYYWGYLLVINAIWEIFGFDKVLKRIGSKRKIEYSFEMAIFLIVAGRFYGCLSENAAGRWMKRIYGFDTDGMAKHHLYRALDILTEQWSKVECVLQDNVIDLFTSHADLLFIDTTSLIYWGDGDDSLCKRGKSKQKRSDKKQVIIGIAIMGGIPVGIEVMPGNTADITVMREMLRKFSLRFSIGEVCIVSDCAMVSIKDLKKYREDGLKYLVGARFSEKMIMEKVKEFRRDPSKWEKVKDDPEMYAREFDSGEEHVIVVLDKNTERYDKRVRESIVEKLKSLEGNDVKELISNKGYKKYLQKGSKIKLNTEKINSVSLLDGIWVVKTNNHFPSLEDAIDRYKELIIVERCFRELKTILKTSPVYHRNANRIKGHIYASFLSLVVDFTLLKRFKELDISGVYEENKTSLKELEVEWIAVKNKEVLIRDEPNSWQRRLFKSFSIKVPPAVLAVR